jgi:hypothetical protein
MVTFALPSEQDPLVFEKVGPKNSVGLVGLIKVHFSSISPHYWKKKGKINHYNLQEMCYLSPFVFHSFLPVFNEPNLHCSLLSCVPLILSQAWARRLLSSFLQQQCKR